MSLATCVFSPPRLLKPRTPSVETLAGEPERGRGEKTGADAGTAEGLWMPAVAALNPPVRHQVSGLLLINVWNDAIGCLYHLNRRLPEELALVVYQLPPEAHVGPDDRPPGFHPVVCLQQAHVVEFHQVRNT